MAVLGIMTNQEKNVTDEFYSTLDSCSVCRAGASDVGRLTPSDAPDGANRRNTATRTP